MSTRKPRTPEDFAAEVESHLAHAADALVADGATPAEATVAARRQFGNITHAQERFYESHRWLWVDHLVQDVRIASRGIRRYPVAASIAILSLAAGIGAMTATLTVRDVLFRKPPPLYHEPGQLSRVQVGRPDRPIAPIGSYVPGTLFAAWRDALGPSIAGATPPTGVRDVRTADRLETLPVRAVTPEFFTVLGVSPIVGGTGGAVLSYRAWQLLFGGRSDVAGQTVWIDNQPYTISGALPPRFWFSDMSSPIWVPLEGQAAVKEESLEVVIRRPGALSHEQLATELESSLRAYAAQLPALDRQLRLKVSGIEGTPMGQAMSVLLPYVLGVSVLLTLVIAVANVAILMIAQWTVREHEIAIRASLGADRWRVVRSLLTESTLLAVGGGALGVCATYALRGWVVHRAGTFGALFDLSIDPRVLLQSAAITVACGIATGIAPALYETRRLHANPLCAIARSDRVRQRWRHALVVVEITVTIALLVEMSAMIDGYERARAAQLGFPLQPFLTARVENAGGVPTSVVLDALRRLPGVAAAAASTTVPYAAFGPAERVAIDANGSRSIVAERGTITPNFFTTLGVRLRTGRAFTSEDSTAMRTAMINETLARRLLAGRDPVGLQVWIDRTAYDIVGVVADYSNNPLQAPQFDAKIFLPFDTASRTSKRVQFLVRSTGDPAPLVQTARRAIRDAAAGNVVARAFTFEQIRDVMGQEMLVGTAPLVPLIAIGMLLTVAGIYGVLAFAIARRSRELAVRVAIGATGRDLVGLVAAHSAGLVTVGVVLGVGITFALSRVVRASGGAGSIYDPPWVAFAVPVAVVAIIAAAASWVPSRRVLKINPALLLRTT